MDNLTLAVLGSAALQTAERSRRELLSCNAVSEQYGLALSQEEVTALVQLQEQALQACGLFGLGSGILPQLARTICDSPYLDIDNYAVTLSGLQQIYYYFRRETAQLDVFAQPADDELCDLLAYAFDAVAGGSVEYLAGTLLEMLIRAFKRASPKKEIRDLRRLFLETPVPPGVERTLDRDWFVRAVLGEEARNDDEWL